MAGIANFADVMLVLAVGIMLALVMNWNVDLAVNSSAGRTGAPIDTERALEFDGADIEPAGGGDEPAGDGMTELGTVYYDAASGKYYIIESEK
jgi:hypothetical protein